MNTLFIELGGLRTLRARNYRKVKNMREGVSFLVAERLATLWPVVLWKIETGANELADLQEKC